VNLTLKQQLMVLAFKGMNQMKAKIQDLETEMDLAEGDVLATIGNESEEIKAALAELQADMLIGINAINNEEYTESQAQNASSSWASTLGLNE